MHLHHPPIIALHYICNLPNSMREWSRVLNIKSNAGLDGRGTGLARQQTQRIVNNTLSSETETHREAMI